MLHFVKICFVKCLGINGLLPLRKTTVILILYILYIYFTGFDLYTTQVYLSLPLEMVISKHIFSLYLALPRQVIFLLTFSCFLLE